MKISGLNFLLYSINYSPELTGIGKYNGEMCEYLATKGHEVTVITAYPYYPEWEIGKDYRKNRFWFKREVINGVTVIRCPIYVPRNVNAITRIIHLSSFGLSSALALLFLLFTKFDVVFNLQPTLTSAPGAILFAKLKGCHSIMHIQDFELDAMLALMGDKVPPPVKRLAYWVERLFMRGFDQVTTISNKMAERARGKLDPQVTQIGTDKMEGNPSNVALLPNWSDLEFVQCGKPSHEFRKKLGVNEGDCMFLYSGNIGKKQGMENLLEVAKRLEDKPEIKFVIVGTGVGKEALVSQAKAMELTNVLFHPLQAWEDVPTLLASANYHLVLQKGDAGDLVLPSKLTNILGIGGTAIVTAHEDTELGIITKQNPGVMICIKPDCPDTLYKTIVDSHCDWEEAKEIAVNKNALLYAEKNLCKTKVLNAFIDGLVAPPSSEIK